MRLLYASERPPFPFFQGGAARSAHYLMSTLVKDYRVECLAIGSKNFDQSQCQWGCPKPDEYGALGVSDLIHDGDDSISIQCGYRVQLISDFRSSLLTVIDDFAPDVIWTQLDGVENITQTARKRGTKTLLYLRDAEDAPTMLKSLAAAGVCIVCNSQFMAERVKRITGKAAHVIYPSLDVTFDTKGDPQGYITMINPNRVKGIDIFLEIARLLPAERFLLVESWTLSGPSLEALMNKLRVLPNVRFQRRVPDVQEIYRQTKLLLVPSVWEEAFGRVVIEAQSCKIPVIASQRGGLSEAVGDGGLCIQDYLNPHAWVLAIQNVLTNLDSYETLAKQAYAHGTGEKFSTHYSASRFLNICSESSFYDASSKYRMQSFFNRLLGIR